METLTLILSGIVGTFATGLSTYLITRKKYQQEVKGQEVANLKEIITIWKETAKEVQDEGTKVKNLNKQLSEQIVQIHTQALSLKMELSEIYQNCISDKCTNHQSKKNEKI